MTARRLRVLHLIQNLNYGGMERLIAELARRADPARLEVHVMALQYVGRFGRELEGCARVHLGPRMPPWSLVRPTRLAEEIARIAPDVVHTHSGVWLKGATAARMAGVRLILHTEHGRRSPDPLDDRLIDRVAARRTDVVVAVSAALAEHLRRRVVGRGPRIEVVTNGVDLDAFRPRADDGAVRAELGIDPGALVLLSIGRLEPVKGYDLALRALAALRDRAPELARRTVLVVAGDGSERRRLEAMARSLGVDGALRLAGWRDDVHALHAAADVFTLTSRSEGTSVSLLEAMAAGLCPVITDVGGNAAVLGPELRHRLSPAGDAGALAAAWAGALADGDRRRADAAAARARVATHFSAEAMARRYEALYRGEPLDAIDGIASPEAIESPAPADGSLSISQSPTVSRSPEPTGTASADGSLSISRSPEPTESSASADGSSATSPSPESPVVSRSPEDQALAEVGG
jgi:glycosyltransferase involved in cell wall biosynthesis